MAKSSAAKPSIEEISHTQLMSLIERVEYALLHDLSVSNEDLRLLLLAITTLCSLQERLEDQDITLNKLRKLLGIVQQSEKRPKKSGGNKPPKPPKPRKEKKKKPVPPVVYHPLDNYHSGMVCPDCTRGKLYKYEPASLLRITGNPPYTSTQHISEQLRCNACQCIKTAPLPAAVLADGAPNQRYGYSARALMVIHKFFSGMPYYHQGNLSDILGFSITASTIFEQCEKVSDAIIPIYYALKREASNVMRFLLDDTHNRILGQMPEYRENRNGKGSRLRTGIYSSGIIALSPEEHEIVLFETSLGHAGEFLDSLLENRTPRFTTPDNHERCIEF